MLGDGGLDTEECASKKVLLVVGSGIRMSLHLALPGFRPSSDSSVCDDLSAEEYDTKIQTPVNHGMQYSG
jgi:hypothetical protein